MAVKGIEKPRGSRRKSHENKFNPPESGFMNTSEPRL
jgi:hypothetical protein